MRKSKIVLAMVGAFMSLAVAAMAQSQIKVADDSSSGTFKKMLGDIIGVCSSDQFNIIEAPGIHGGAPGNLDALLTNKAQAAFVDSDVFLISSQADPSYRRIKALVNLYPDPIHVIALVHSKTKRNYVSKQEFNSLSDARGYKVGAAGGGVYTLRLITGQGQAGFEVVPFQTGDDVIKALNDGTIALAVFVGAAPLPNLEKLNQANPGVYKLIPINGTIADNLKGVYKQVSINYPGMTNGPVTTMAPWAVILTRQYSTPEKMAAQRNFRNCFTQQLPTLKDNASANWQDVDPTGLAGIDYLDLPR